MIKNTRIILSERLIAASSMITKGNIVCDVGCDHGFVSIYLVQNGICPRAIAMDVNEGPLNAAKEHILDYGLSKYIETRLSDGIAGLSMGEAETMFCAGMGGILMQRILQDGKDKTNAFKELILQPQSKIEDVRAYLRKQGYQITDEKMIFEDGKYYPMMRAVSSEKVLLADSEAKQRVEDKYGPMLLRGNNEVLFEFLKREQNICENILLQMEAAEEIKEVSVERKQERTKEIEDRIADIRTALSYYEN